MGQPNQVLGYAYAGGRGNPPQGIHAGWTWNGVELTARVDRLGYYSLFYYRDADSITVSPSLIQLLAQGAATELDHRALGIFFRLGLFINNDTPFKQIRVLPPSGELTWRRGELRVTGGHVIPPQISISRAQAVQGFIDLTRQSMRRILASWSGPFVLPLSGGRDSRHILLELNNLRSLPATCATFHHGGEKLNDEALAARAIAQRVGVRHAILGHHRSRPKDVLRALVATQLCSDEHYQMMPLHDFLRVTPGAAFDGIAGDILSAPDSFAQRFFELARRGDYAGIARSLFDGHARVISRPGRAQQLNQWPGTVTDEEAVEYLSSAIRTFDAAADPYQAFWFWNRTRREISFVPTAILASAEAVFCPYLDYELVSFCLALPFDVTRDGQLHNEAIATAYREFADVPFQEHFSRALVSTSLAQKAQTMVDGLQVMSLVGSRNLSREMAAQLLGLGPLRRQFADIYRLYRLCLESMDAVKARRLLQAASALQEGAPRNPVTSTHDPEILSADAVRA